MDEEIGVAAFSKHKVLWSDVYNTIKKKIAPVQKF